MTRKARIGVIGAGWWAVANHLPILEAREDVELMAVCRLGREELRAVARRFGFGFATEDYREMLDTVELDGVIIASPHVLHYEHARAALERGLHVLIEKPLTTSAELARELVALARKKNLEIIIPYGWNFKPYTREAHRLLGKGAVGEVRHVVLQMASALGDLFAGEGLLEAEEAMFKPPASTWADPEHAGGYGWGQLIHALGLLFRITELPPKRVFAWMGLSPIGVDYYDAISMQFENGATASVSGAATVPKHMGFQIDLDLRNRGDAASRYRARALSGPPP